MPIESTAQRIAANVRAELARQQRSGADLAKSLSWSQAAMQRRLSGRVAFDVTELDAVATQLEIPLGALIGEAVV